MGVTLCDSFFKDKSEYQKCVIFLNNLSLINTLKTKVFFWIFLDSLSIFSQQLPGNNVQEYPMIKKLIIQQVDCTPKLHQHYVI